jgi:uncharacterized BrkB/YihY/UPF0761 family membrane protein
MRFGHLVPLIAALVGTVASPAQAQYPQPIPAARPLQFESWRAASPGEVSSKLTVRRLVPDSRNRTRQALLGGAIGAAAGIVVCTAFSTLINDSAKGGLSFCPLDTNLLFGGAGFVLGAAIGWAI